jgi:glycosyltransferase involved in cell wall biosynthesis
MRALMVTPFYYPIKGGAETLIRNLSIKLNQTGIHTDVITFNMTQKWKPHWQTKIEELNGLTVYKIPGLNWYPLQHSDRITQGVNLIPGRFRHFMQSYDVLHYHAIDLTFPLYSVGIKKPKIAHFHSQLDFYERYAISRLILKNMADLYIAISYNMIDELIKLGVKEDKIRYLPNGVDTNIFKPSGVKEENLLVFVGRITFGKGLHVLLNALEYLKTKVHLVIIGPPDWNIHYFQQIQNQIGMENRKGFHEVSYLGMQEQETVVKWCQKASVFILPSFIEAAGISIMEALACETAVVATNIVGIREVVEISKSGILVPPNNSKELANAIQYLLDNESARTKLGKQGRKCVLEIFTYKNIIERLTQIYKELV